MMKTISKSLFAIGFLLILLPLAVEKASFAKQPHHPEVKKVVAHRVIHKTAIVILVAHKKVNEGKVYTGNLARAIAHQHFARKLYREGKYLRAIHHSRRSRILAIMAIKANKGVEESSWKFNKEEEESMKGAPSENELDKALAKEMPNEPSKDEDVVTTSPDVDVSDKE